MNDFLPPSLASEIIRTHKAEGIDPKALGDALALFRMESATDQTVLYREGDRADELQLLVSGTVAVLVDGERREVARVQAPAIIGHLGVLTGLTRSATVRAVGELRFGRMRDRDLWDLIARGEAPGIALRRLMLSSLVGLMGTTNTRLQSRVAESGTPVPEGSVEWTELNPEVPPTASGRRRRPQAAQAGASDTWGFDEDLLAAADEIRIVDSEADKARTYKR